MQEMKCLSWIPPHAYLFLGAEKRENTHWDFTYSSVRVTDPVPEEEEETRGNIGCCEALRCQSKPNLSLWIHDKQRTRMVTKLV